MELEMETQNISHLVNPANPYAFVGSGSSYNPVSVEEEANQTKANVIIHALGTAFLASAITHGIWTDVGIKESEISRGLNFYRPLSLNNNVRVINQTLSENELGQLHSVQDQINTIVKSLNPGGMSGLATLLHVSRPTIYKWLEETSELKLENQKRLALLFGIAEHWNSLSSEPLKQGQIKRQLPSGTTLFDILAEADLSIEEANNAIEVLAKSQNRSSDAIKRFKTAISTE